MSNIPRARAILEEAEASDWGNEKFLRYCIHEARKFLDREKPEFRVARHVPTMTIEQVEEARRLRAAGWGLQQIANHLGTQIGRVSEAVNGLRDGV